MQWDWLKYNIYYIRKETIHYSKAKAKQRRERINSIENKLKLAEEEQAVTPTVENLNKLENLKTEYEKEYVSTSLEGRSFVLGSTGMKKVIKTISIFLTLKATTRPKARFENSART